MNFPKELRLREWILFSLGIKSSSISIVVLAITLQCILVELVSILAPPNSLLSVFAAQKNVSGLLRRSGSIAGMWRTFRMSSRTPFHSNSPFIALAMKIAITSFKSGLFGSLFFWAFSSSFVS